MAPKVQSRQFSSAGYWKSHIYLKLNKKYFGSRIWILNYQTFPSHFTAYSDYLRTPIITLRHFFFLIFEYIFTTNFRQILKMRSVEHNLCHLCKWAWLTKGLCFFETGSLCTPRRISARVFKSIHGRQISANKAPCLEYNTPHHESERVCCSFFLIMVSEGRYFVLQKHTITKTTFLLWLLTSVYRGFIDI